MSTSWPSPTATARPDPAGLRGQLTWPARPALFEGAMQPDFAAAFLRGVIQGVAGLLTQPPVVIVLIAVIGVTILAWLRRR